MRLIFAVIVLAIAAIPAAAGDYIFRNGFYWHNNAPYNRYVVTQPAYYYNNCYYPAYQQYQYVAAPAPVAAADWRTSLLELAAQRDKYEGQIRKNAAEQASYLEAIRALGLQGNFSWQSYGASPYGPNFGANANSYGYAIPNGYGVNATTNYGYSYQSIAGLYGDMNLNQLYQQAAQLAQGSQRAGADATAGFSSLVATEGQNRARVAEILARGQVVAQALALPAETRINGFSIQQSTTAQQGVQQQGQPQGQPNNDSLQQLSVLAGQRCAACHSGDTKRGGFDISVYPNLTREQKQVVVNRLTTDDPQKIMPRNPDGTPGKKLTPEELRLFLMN